MTNGQYGPPDHKYNTKMNVNTKNNKLEGISIKKVALDYIIWMFKRILISIETAQINLVPFLLFEHKINKWVLEICSLSSK